MSMFSRQRAGVDEMLPEHLVEDVVDERALAGTRRSGDGDKLAQWDRDVDRLPDCSRARPGSPAPCRCHFDGSVGVRIERLPDRNCPAGDVLHFDDVVDVTLHDDLAAVHSRSGAHFDDVIGGANGVFVVFDDNHGVADVAKALKRRNRLGVVLRMQADARLVEHVEHAHQTESELGRQPNPLRLTTESVPERRLKLR